MPPCRVSPLMFDRRPVLSRDVACEVYDDFALKGHLGGKDASSGYGGPAVQALLELAALANASTVVEYGCGQAKLAELALARHANIASWRAVDQSPHMCLRAHKRMRPFGARFAIEHHPSGDPAAARLGGGADRFVSTYVLDLLSEDDMLATLDLARRSLAPDGRLLLAGIT